MNNENQTQTLPQSVGSGSNTILPPPTNLDPQVVKVMSAIKQVESGGDYNASGDNGSSYGAFQWNNGSEPIEEGGTPVNWQKAAQQYLGSATAPMTPENQNFVAYNQIAQYKAQGLSPMSIDALWNGAKADPSNPGQFIHNSPQRATEFQSALQQIVSGQLQPPTTPTSPQDTTSSQTASNPSHTLESLLFGGAGAALAIGSVLGAPETGGASLEGLPEAGALAGEAGGSGILGTIGSTIGKFAANPVGTALGALGVEQAGQDTVGAVGKLLGVGNTPPTNETTINQTQGSQMTPQEIQNAMNTSNSITQAVTGIGNQTQSGTRMMQSPEGQQGAQTIGQYGFTPDINEEGRMDWSGASKSASAQGMELNTNENKILDAEGATGNVDEVASKAKEIIRKTMPSTDWDEADKQIDADAQHYKDKFGDGDSVVPLGSEGVGRIRNEGYKAYDRNASTAKNGARKAMGSAANSHILEKTKHKELIEGLHKEKQKLIHAQKVMKFLDGKKAPGHKGALPALFKKYGEYVGVAIGDKIGGGLGAVIGAMVGNHISRAVDKKYGKSEFESPALKEALNLLHKKKPAVYNAVKNELAKYNIDTTYTETSPKTAVKKNKPIDLDKIVKDLKSKGKKFDLEGARKGGYSDEEIHNFLQGNKTSPLPVIENK